MKGSTRAALTAVVLMVAAVSLPDDEPPAGQPAAAAALPPAASSTPVQPAATPLEVVDSPAAVAPTVEPALLQAAGGGDGDSWRDIAGREYRLGLVNTPERDECFGREATAKRKQLTAGGFRAATYATDAYGRSVAVVTLPDGTNVNLWLARHGYANAKYLKEYRAERPALATELDAAFAAAERERVGLWAACSDAAPGGIAALPPVAAPQRPAPAADGSCHPDYRTCIPVAGDGSGRGQSNDLDCGEIGRSVELRRTGTDPYRLDREGDGTGCE